MVKKFKVIVNKSRLVNVSGVIFEIGVGRGLLETKIKKEKTGNEKDNDIVMFVFCSLVFFSDHCWGSNHLL